MANNQSLLTLTEVPITSDISIRIPTVGEILTNEQSYYSVTSALTASPFTYMVQLDDMGIDYTTIDEWQLFRMLFKSFADQLKVIDLQIYDIQGELKNIKQDTVTYYEKLVLLDKLSETKENTGLNMVFGEMNISGFEAYEDPKINDGKPCLYNSLTNTLIDKTTYQQIANTIRKINLYEHVKSKPGNESAKKYLLEKERRKLKRNAKKPYKSYLENLVVALVNTSEFPYDYESCMDLSIYKFNQSFKQIQHKLTFDNTMIGVYAGTVNTSKMNNKDYLSWIQTNSK